MTTVVYSRGQIAGDTLLGGSRTLTLTKVARDSNGRLAGASGHAWFVEEFITWFLNDCDYELSVHNHNDEFCNAFIADKDGSIILFEVHGGEVRRFTPEVMHGYFAIGSGADHALGALAMGATAERAVEVAMMFDAGTGGSITTFTHRGKK